MDIATISLVLVIGLLITLAIGMPLGLASAVLALLVMVMKFEPALLTDPATFGDGLLTGRPGTGPLYILCLLYTSPSPRDRTRSRMPSSA